MRCERQYGPGNRVTGYICGGRRGSPPKLPPCECGNPSVYECDGPPDPGTRRKTCDRPMCARCAVSIRALDVDFCPTCARLVGPLDCLLAGDGPAMPAAPTFCMGALVLQHDLCVRHAVLFDHWLAFAGGSRVYATAEMDRRKKREVHRRWLVQLSAVEASQILGGRHAPVA